MDVDFLFSHLVLHKIWRSRLKSYSMELDDFGTLFGSSNEQSIFANREFNINGIPIKSL